MWRMLTSLPSKEGTRPGRKPILTRFISNLRSCYILEWELFENFFLADLWRGNPSQTPLIALWQQLQANITSSKSHFLESLKFDWLTNLWEVRVQIIIWALCALCCGKTAFHICHPHIIIILTINIIITMKLIVSILMLQFSSFFIISPVSPPYCSQQVWKYCCWCWCWWWWRWQGWRRWWWQWRWRWRRRWWWWWQTWWC